MGASLKGSAGLKCAAALEINASGKGTSALPQYIHVRQTTMAAVARMSLIIHVSENALAILALASAQLKLKIQCRNPSLNLLSNDMWLPLL